MSGQGEEPAPPRVPTDDDIRLAMMRTMEKMFLHSEANTKTLLELRATVAGVQAGNQAVAEVVDDNEDQAETDRRLAAAKELMTHLYEKSHQYVTVIIAGAFAAYFATLGILSERFSDTELLTSALLMTASLTVFVLWEVCSIAFISFHSLRGDLGKLTEAPRWQRIGWPLAMFGSLATALPAIGLSVWVYLRRLGAIEWLGSLFN